MKGKEIFNQIYIFVSLTGRLLGDVRDFRLKLSIIFKLKNYFNPKLNCIIHGSSFAFLGILRVRCEWWNWVHFDWLCLGHEMFSILFGQHYNVSAINLWRASSILWCHCFGRSTTMRRFRRLSVDSLNRSHPHPIDCQLSNDWMGAHFHFDHLNNSLLFKSWNKLKNRCQIEF